MSSNTHGFTNEQNIVDEFNKENPVENIAEFKKYVKKVKNLQNQELIAEIVSNNNYKADIMLKTGNNSFGVSIKEGNSNSVHQEKIDQFTEFIQDNEDIRNASDDIVEEFEWFINSKKNARELKRNHPERLKDLNEFIDENDKRLAERFVKTGGKDKKFADFVYYGRTDEGVWAETDEALDQALSRNNGQATLPLGSLTLQAWNRTNEEKRYTLQVKWGRIEQDLKEVE